MRILLVEDDTEQLEPLHTALTEAGHIVDGVEDGETAQWLLSEKDYDLLILDWLLPEISGGPVAGFDKQVTLHLC